MKLIVDIDKDRYKDVIEARKHHLLDSYAQAVANGIPLDKMRAEIEQNAYPIVHGVNNHEKGMTLYGILQIIDKYKGDKE